MGHAAEVGACVSVTLACTAALFLGVDASQKWFLARRERICWVSMAWVTLSFVLITALARTTQRPVKGLLTTSSWYSAGWGTGLNVFSVPVDTWFAYTLVVNYQIVRSVLGSLLTNFFRSWLLVTVQATNRSKAGARAPGAQDAAAKQALPSVAMLVAAQASYDIFVFYSSLTDTFLLMSQADLTLVTLITTLLADSVSTVYFCWQPEEARLEGGEAKNASNRGIDEYNNGIATSFAGARRTGSIAM
jgi:uncharacterized protein YqgC (DUF456 family)